tara:strand:- start:617 stop:2512 length:1896 start_codon:yes stop_codon:yes gene_type:complete
MPQEYVVTSLTFDKATSIPVQLGKWLALVEEFGARYRDRQRVPDEIFGEPDICSCRPSDIQLLKNGAVRVLFETPAAPAPFYARMAPWVKTHSRRTEADVIASKPMPMFVWSYYKCPQHKCPLDCAKALAEVLLTLLDTFRAIGSSDHGTLRDCFEYYLTEPRRRHFEHGPLTNSKVLTENQMATIVCFSNDYRNKWGFPNSGLSARPPSSVCSDYSIQRLRDLAESYRHCRSPCWRSEEPSQPSLLEQRVRELEVQEGAALSAVQAQHVANQERCNVTLRANQERRERIQQCRSDAETRWTPPPPSLLSPAPPPMPRPERPPPSGCVDACPPDREDPQVRVMQHEACLTAPGHVQSPTPTTPVAMECMAFTCGSVEDVPIMVAKLMAVCSSDKIGPGQVRPHELQVLDNSWRHNPMDSLATRVVMHVHRMVADKVRQVPDWAQPYPVKDERPGLILLRARLVDWDEGGIVVPLAHSVRLAALMHAWFEQYAKAASKRCRKFLELIKHGRAQDLALTEEQQHILLELSEEYLALLCNEWCEEPKEATECRDSPNTVVATATEFPKLGTPPSQDVEGRTTYLNSMFAITKPTMRPLDLKQLGSVAYLSPYRKDMIWCSGPRVSPAWMARITA